MKTWYFVIYIVQGEKYRDMNDYTDILKATERLMEIREQFPSSWIERKYS